MFFIQKRLHQDILERSMYCAVYIVHCRTSIFNFHVIQEAHSRIKIIFDKATGRYVIDI